MKRLSILFLFLVLSVAAWAQSGVSVRMKLADAKTGEPVGFATVSLSYTDSGKAYRYVLSTAEGSAEFAEVRTGKFLLKAEMMGYVTFEKEILVAGANVDLGTLQMAQDAQVLEAASVTAAGNEILVKKDTVEYYASSFKTTDNDTLEELLKKLPGVEVDSDGTITVNGEEVTKIMIGGKEFFLDDPSLASKNIPAKVIEKLQVVEKKSDQAIFSGIDDGERETVIDLSVKKGMLGGWFGNLMGGGGHDIPEKGHYSADGNRFGQDWRYQGAAMVGRFTESSQISFMLNGNNTNNRGFKDMAGSMMQNMRGDRGKGRNSGWGGNNGITTSWMAGANGSFTLFDGDMDLNGNYLYSGTDKTVEEDSRKITYMDNGSSLIYDNDGYNLTSSQGHRFGVRLEHRFGENTSILFRPQVNFGSGNYTEYSNFTTYTDPGDGSDQTLTNTGFNENTGQNKNWNAKGFLLFRQRLGKPGRTLSANVDYDFSGNRMSGLNQSYTDSDPETDGDEEIVNQRYSSTSNSSSVSVRAVYTEPIVNNFFIEANYSYRWSRSTSYKDTYDSGGDGYAGGDGSSLAEAGHMTYDPDGETYSDAYSNSIVNTYQNHSAGFNLMYQKEKLRAQVGASLRPTITDNETNGEDYNSTVINWSPQVLFSYDMSDHSNVRLFYNGRSSQPSTSQLMPVADNSDPLDISFGNPYLEPYFTHRLHGEFGYTDDASFLSIRGDLNGRLIQNTITNAVWYDSAGAQYALPLNGPTSGSIDMRVMLNSPVGHAGFSVFATAYLSYSHSVSYVGRTEGGMGDRLIADYYNPETGALDYETFHRDFFDHDDPSSMGYFLDDYFSESLTRSISSTERLRFTYRNDVVEVNLGGRTRISKSWYSISSENQSATWNNRIDASVNWTLPEGFGLAAQANYNWYDGYTTKQDDSVVFNAEISKLLCDNKLTITAKAYDIFNQSQNLSVTDSSNYHQEVRNNTLGRYIMLSLTYRFGNFSAAASAGPDRRRM